jgi:folate-dependent tRNA-U54 methylase TrmFO/GidA
VTSEVTIVGGGMAGSEAAWQLAQAGIVAFVEIEVSPPTGGGGGP